jgi:4-hydroxy-tetrahydrodipicolinate reductase
MIKLALFGRGKLGSWIERLAPNYNVKIVAFEEADVVVDATAPAAVMTHIERALMHDKPIVVATTGWYQHLQNVQNLVTHHDGFCLYSPNFAPLMQNLFTFTQLLDLQNLSVEIEETHHVQKKDAPSGTALALSTNLGEAKITSFREGSNLGQHKIIIESPYEKICIDHICLDRSVFARGILEVLPKIQNNKGLYNLKDFLCSLQLPQPR